MSIWHVDDYPSLDLTNRVRNNETILELPTSVLYLSSSKGMRVLIEEYDWSKLVDSLVLVPELGLSEGLKVYLT